MRHDFAAMAETPEQPESRARHVARSFGWPWQWSYSPVWGTRRTFTLLCDTYSKREHEHFQRRRVASFRDSAAKVEAGEGSEVDRHCAKNLEFEEIVLDELSRQVEDLWPVRPSLERRFLESTAKSIRRSVDRGGDDGVLFQLNYIKERLRQLP